MDEKTLQGKLNTLSSDFKIVVNMFAGKVWSVYVHSGEYNWIEITPNYMSKQFSASIESVTPIGFQFRIGGVDKIDEMINMLTVARQIIASGHLLPSENEDTTP